MAGQLVLELLALVERQAPMQESADFQDLLEETEAKLNRRGILADQLLEINLGLLRLSQLKRRAMIRNITQQR